MQRYPSSPSCPLGQPDAQRVARMSRAGRGRHAFTLLEVLVAATLFASGLALFAKLAVHHGRMWQQTRHERLAIEELTNQLDRLVALAPGPRATALERLDPSPAVAEVLVDAWLQVEAIDDADGNRLVLSIDWKRGYPAEPLTLVGWVESAPVSEATP